MMVRKHAGVRTGYLSRRDVIRGAAGLMIAMSLDGCAQALSSPPAIAPSPTPRPHGSILQTFRGHIDRVTSVAWSPNGKYIVSGSIDQTVRIWSVSPVNHTPVYIYHGHTAGVQTVDWSPDSNRVVSGSIDKTVQVWDALTGEQATVYHGHTGFVNTVAWSPDGKKIASGSADNTVRIWDVTTGKVMYVYRGHQASVTSIVWSPDSSRLASGAMDKTVQIVDATSGNLLYTYRGHTDIVSSVSWSPDGKYIASGSWDKTVQVWNATTGAVLYTYEGYNVREAPINKGVAPDLIFIVAWSHDGKRIAAVTQVYCGDLCAVVLSWDAYTQGNFTFYLDEPLFSLVWSPDDTRFATAIYNSQQGTEHAGVQPQDGSYVQISQA